MCIGKNTARLSRKGELDLDNLLARRKESGPLILITEILDRPGGVASATIVSGDISLQQQEQEE